MMMIIIIKLIINTIAGASEAIEIMTAHRTSLLSDDKVRLLAAVPPYHSSAQPLSKVLTNLSSSSNKDFEI